jgi:cellobiose phosphorylase
MRAFDDSGKPVGSKACSEGKIFLETQAWAVLSGVADRKNATTSLDSADKHLFTPYGLVLLQPAYRHYQPQLGEISTYPPGLKENAAVFCHVNPWVIIAECMLGRADKAYKFYRAILPEAQNEIAEIRKTEPYVYCQMAAGKDHVDAGECKNSWLTGSASWNFIAGAEYILGVRPEYSGLIIDPCIPKKWNGFTVTRVYRGCTYIIAVKNPSHVSKGVSKITLDKVPLDTNLVPAQNDGKTHRVEVVMG